VPRMPSSRAPGHTVRARRREQLEASRRRRRLVALGVASFVLLVTLMLTAFGSGGRARNLPSPALASRLLPAGPPSPQVIALAGTLRIQLPVSQRRLTAIGYRGTEAGAMALQPLGRQGNQGILTRLLHKVFGGGRTGLRYYLLGGDGGPSTGLLDVGAPSGTDVYSPVDGTVVGLTPYVVNQRIYGARIDVQPSGSPSLVVTMTRLRPDPSLTVGSSVTAGSSKIGTVLDLSSVERQALARYTQDAGNHVSVEVRAAATLAAR
jgi:murein DD-endopeptidase MepM/ murein hydrolase activator NlpD